MRTKEDILNIIEEENVEFIRLQFTDVMGNLKNIAITPGQIDRALNNRYSFQARALFDGAYDYPDELYLHPDFDTFAILPWRPQQGKVAKVVCDVCDASGQPFMLSSRKILKNVLKDAEKMGYTFMVDPECEFYLFHTDENGLPTVITHEKAGYMDVGPVDFGENARRDMVLMLEELGFDVESSHHEHSSSQHEIDFSEQEALVSADSIQTFRFAVRSVAKRFGLYATFMPKPKADVAGTGMHTNFTMLKDGRNVFRGKDGKPSEEAMYFVGGLLAHANALLALSNPLVNSYKRLGAGFESPSHINWATRGEKCFVKLASRFGDVKLETRFPDGACNPYLLIAGVIVAGLDGIKNKIEPGEDSYEKSLDNYEKLVGNLKEAITAFENDSVMVEAFSKEFVDIYSKIKNAEWDEYMRSISEWEIEKYLPRI